MFTGIIEQTGSIIQISNPLWIKSSFTDLTLGESISVDGVCLTVTALKEDGLFSCDISEETLRLTTASHYKLQQKVNLERSLQLSSRLGGHMVMGHVDQVCYLHAKKKMGDFIEMRFQGVTEKVYLIKKGSIALNGVSLTINEITQDDFSVMLIPHTLASTNLGELNLKDAVNLEFDMMARVIV